MFFDFHIYIYTDIITWSCIFFYRSLLILFSFVRNAKIGRPVFVGAGMPWKIQSGAPKVRQGPHGGLGQHHPEASGQSSKKGSLQHPRIGPKNFFFICLFCFANVYFFVFWCFVDGFLCVFYDFECLGDIFQFVLIKKFKLVTPPVTGTQLSLA